MKKLALTMAVALILVSLVVPVLAQGEGLDLSPVPGKFKIVFRNCLRVAVRADVKGLDFWEGEIPGWVDVPECPSRVAVVRTTSQGGDRYSGTMGATFNGETFTLGYDFDSAPGGVTVVSFLNEHTVEVKPVDTSTLPPTTPTTTPGPPAEEPTATTSPPAGEPTATTQAQPAAAGVESAATPAGATPAAPSAPVAVPSGSYSASETFADVPPYIALESSAPLLPGSTPVYYTRPQSAPLKVLPVTGIGAISIKSPWVPALVGLLLAFVARRISRQNHRDTERKE
jgi:hypothetical protein